MRNNFSPARTQCGGTLLFRLETRMSSSSTSDAGSTELFSRVQNFFSENKKVILIGTAAAAIGIAGAYYVSTTTRLPLEDDLEKAASKKKGKGKKRKSVKDRDSPILEERKSRVSDTQTNNVTKGMFWNY